MPILSDISRRLKQAYFLDRISIDHQVLEIGCGDGWVGQYLKKRGVRRVDSIDTTPQATIYGDVREWKSLGLAEQSFDVIVAFEVIEHVDCMEDCFALLRPGGQFMITSPNPSTDWILLELEKWKLNQPRTSPHDHLTFIEETARFRVLRMWRPLKLAQWCILERKFAASYQGTGNEAPVPVGDASISVHN